MPDTPKIRKLISNKDREAPARTRIYDVPILAIVASDNSRFPLDPRLEALGYGGFDPIPGTGCPSLWQLATSAELADREHFVQLVEENDPPDAEESLINIAYSILDHRQFHPVIVRDNGKQNAGGKSTYTLVEGNRRCFAMLYLWCKKLSNVDEPTVEATLMKGSNQSLSHINFIENYFRMNPSIREKAQWFQQQLNTGMSVAALAQKMNVHPSTIHRTLQVLDLPEDEQRKVDRGEITLKKAIETYRERARRLSPGSDADELVVPQAATPLPRPRPVGVKVKPMSKKQITEVLHTSTAMGRSADWLDGFCTGLGIEWTPPEVVLDTPTEDDEGVTQVLAGPSSDETRPALNPPVGQGANGHPGAGADNGNAVEDQPVAETTS
jgi:ParB/RepB/Spo0J family partition protein